MSTAQVIERRAACGGGDAERGSGLQKSASRSFAIFHHEILLYE
jgi:hypothetical protein